MMASEPTKRPHVPASAPQHAPVRRVRFGKRLGIVLVVLSLLPWLVVVTVFRKTDMYRNWKAGQWAAAAASPEGRSFFAAPGRWGTLELTRIALEVPREFTFTHLEGVNNPEWYFKGHTREQVEALFAGADLTADQRDSLARRANWVVRPDGVLVFPEPALILSLGPAARQRIYTVLTKYWENGSQRLAFVFNPELLDERFEGSGLRPELIAEVRRLLYPQGRFVMFADLYPLMSTLTNEVERQALARLCSRQWTYLIQLQVGAYEDVQELARYWSGGYPSKDVQPLLESLRRVPGGTQLDISHLLPQFARRRIYTFPVPTGDPVELRHDCHWTAYNFFSETPDDRFIEPAYVRSVFEANYQLVPDAPRFGDLAVIFSPDETVLHSAVYIADDLVFCKNGAHFSQPWMFMKVADMMDYYIAVYQPDHEVRLRYFRRQGE